MAQELTFSVKRYGPEEGLLTQTAHASALDTSGFRWVATTRGLHRIEGQVASAFDFTESTGLSAHIADVLSMDGGLLICAHGWEQGIDSFESGVSVVDVQSGEARVVDFGAAQVPDNPNLVRFDGDDTVYLVGRSHSLFQIDPESQRAEQVFTGANVQYVEPINDGHLSGRKAFLATTWDGRFQVWYNRHESWASVDLPEYVEVGMANYCIDVTEAGCIRWLSPLDQEVLEWRFNGECRKLPKSMLPGWHDGRLAKSLVLPDRDETWILHATGLEVWQTSEERLLGTCDLPEWGFDITAQVHLSFENEQSVWIATPEGLCHIHIKQPYFQTESLRPDPYEPACRAIQEVAPNVVLVLTDDFTLWQRARDSVTTWPGQHQIADMEIMGGDAAVFVNVDEIHRVNLKTGHTDVLGQTALPTKVNWALTTVPGEDLLVFGEEALQTFSLTSGSAAHHPFEGISDDLAKPIIQCLEWRDETLWVLTTDGVWHWKPGDEKVRRWSPASDQPVGTWFDVVPDGRGSLWFATSNQGILRWQLSDSSWAVLPKRLQGFEERVYGIEVDPLGRLWFSTDRGIAGFDPAPGSEKLRFFGLDDGLEELEFNRSSHHHGASGRMYFGGIHGYVSFDPMSIPLELPEGQSTRIGLIGLSFFSASLGEMTSVLPAFHEDGEVHMDHRDAFLSVKVCPLGRPLAAPLFRYRVKGQTLFWEETGQTEFRINGLDPGQYFFEVEAMGEDGDWSTAGGLRFPIVVRAPFYRKPAGQAAIAFSMFGSILAAGFIRRRRLERANARLEQKVAERTHRLNASLEALRSALALKEVYLGEMHHRVKNNLQVIAGLLELQRSGIADATAQEAMSTAQFRVDAMGRIHQRLIHEAEHSDLEVEPLLRQLFDLLAIAHPTMKVQLALSVTAKRLDGDSAISLGMIANELLMNSFKHAFDAASDSGQIQITLHPTPNPSEFVFTYADNGPGIPPDAERPDDGRVGMQLVHQLARQLMGSLSLTGNPRRLWRLTFLNKKGRKSID